MLSPELFSLYSEIILRTIKDRPEIRIRGANINNLRYADDIVLIAGREEELQDLVHTINQESGIMGLSPNIKKTETMAISKKKDPPTCAIRIGNKLLKQVHNFKYLGTRISADGKCKAEVTARIMQEKKVFGQMKQILINLSMSMKVSRRVLDCYILPALIHGCEAWTISKEIENQLRATETWFLRRTLRISYVDKMRNEEVLERTGTTRSLVKEARKRQAVFFGHVMRRKE